MLSGSAPRLPRHITALPLRSPTLPPATHTTCYLIGRRELSIIDPGSPFGGEIDRLLRLVWRRRGRGATFRRIILTHHHADHVGGVPAVVDALRVPVAAHPATIERLAPRLARPALRWEPLVEGDRLVGPDGATAQVLHTPGHAAGHLCLFLPRGQALLCGDMVPGRGTTLVSPAEGDMAVYVRSLERLAALEPALLLPAHGPALAPGGRPIRALIAHRRWRERRVLAALRPEPRPLEAVAREAYPEARPLQWSLCVQSTAAHLFKLEAEGRAARCGERGWRRSG